MSARLTRVAAAAIVMACADRAATSAEAGDARPAALLRAVEQRQHNAGDWRAVVYVEQREKGRDLMAYEMIVMRRSATGQFVLLFTKPSPVAGQAYLRLEGNSWFYDPAVARWERRSERERIGNSSSRRSDLDEWHYADDYVAEDGGPQAVGQRPTRRLILKAKPGRDLPFPVVHLWIDEDSKTVLKRQEFALSGRLLRTTYYPRWEKIFSAAKRADVWYPQEIRFYDELEPAKSTLIMIKDVNASPLPEEIFTKTWVEHQRR